MLINFDERTVSAVIRAGDSRRFQIDLKKVTFVSLFLFLSQFPNLLNHLLVLVLPLERCQHFGKLQKPVPIEPSPNQRVAMGFEPKVVENKGPDPKSETQKTNHKPTHGNATNKKALVILSTSNQYTPPTVVKAATAPLAITQALPLTH